MIRKVTGSNPVDLGANASRFVVGGLKKHYLGS
jgi:hypothetical protein